MRSLSKSFGIILIVICMFSYMMVASAATGKLKDVEKNSISAVIQLLSGSSLAGDSATTITNLMDKYTLYTKYEKINDELYSKYKADTSNSEVGNSIANLITDPASKSDLDNADNGWSLVESTQITYSDLEKDKGYLIALMAVSKSDESKIYSYKTVYQATTSSTLSTYSDIANNNVGSDADVEKSAADKDVNKEETDDSEAEDKDDSDTVEKDTEEKADTNPETGINDYAIYLVPLSIIAGSTLMIRKKLV